MDFDNQGGFFLKKGETKWVDNAAGEEPESAVPLIKYYH